MELIEIKKKFKLENCQNQKKLRILKQLKKVEKYIEKYNGLENKDINLSKEIIEDIMSNGSTPLGILNATFMSVFEPDYAILRKGIELQNYIVNSKDPELCVAFASAFGDIDYLLHFNKRMENIIIKSKDAKLIYMYASKVRNMDKQKVGKALLETKNIIYCYKFLNMLVGEERKEFSNELISIINQTIPSSTEENAKLTNQSMEK